MFLVTLQRQSDYATKTKNVETQAELDTLVLAAIDKSVAVVNNDTFDGIDCGLVRALRLASKTSEYVMTVHKLY